MEKETSAKNWYLEVGAIVGQETSFLWRPTDDDRYAAVFCKPVDAPEWIQISGNLKFHNPQDVYQTTKFTPISREAAFLMIL